MNCARCLPGYVEAKQRQQVLDYDDLLLYWYYLMEEPALARQVAERFDHVLVDEYQDTNALQAAILLALRPDGEGLTVVGDDAQAIYGFPRCERAQHSRLSGLLQRRPPESSPSNATTDRPNRSWTPAMR